MINNQPLNQSYVQPALIKSTGILVVILTKVHYFLCLTRKSKKKKMNKKVKQVRVQSKHLATFILFPRAALLLVTAGQKERGLFGREGSISTTCTMNHYEIVSFSCDNHSYFVSNQYSQNQKHIT